MSDRLHPGEKLRPAEGLVSKNEKFVFVMQEDGNLVLYPNGNPNALWASGTNGHSVGEAVLQDDGNFVIYGEGRALWASATHGSQVAYLVVQNDGNVVIYHANGTALWATDTVVSPDRLHPGEKLRPGERLASEDKEFFLVMQEDGNLVLYPNGNPNALWASGTNGNSVGEAVLQEDGNFVIYGEGRALWASATHGNQVAYLVVQNDGNVVIYHANGAALWATNTVMQSSGALIAYAVGLREEGGASDSSGPSVPMADFDHTFVQSNKGHKWGCWGRDDDPMKREIANGGGRHRIKMAECLAKPNGTAGIVWAVTGTCHQCANRILFPAGLTVSKARGYAGSVLLYGVYGTDYPIFMTNVARCKLIVNPIHNPLPIDFPDWDDINPFAIDGVEMFTKFLNEEEVKYHKEVFKLYTTERNMQKRLASDMELLLQHRLQNHINSPQMNNLKNLQADLRKEHTKLTTAMFTGEITHQLFVKQINELLKQTMQRFERVIGENNFLLAFDSPPDRASQILNISTLTEPE